MEMKKYKLSEIAYFVEEKISSDRLTLNEYITTDCLLQNKKGRTVATNLPPQPCGLTKFKKGDVLIGNIRPYLKKLWFADSDGGCSLDVLVLRAKKIEEASFLYSLLMQDDFFDFVMKAPTGTKMPRGDKNHILSYPCFDIQNKIKVGNFIKLLDDKIALNHRINAKLEAMAKRLYDYWFVQFDYPDKNGKPYKTSGGKMVWNEVLKREIPEGWEVGKIEDFCRIFTGKKDVNQSLESGRYKFFSCAPVYKFSNDKIFEGKAILISGNGSYTGRTIFVNDAFDLYQRTYCVVLKTSTINCLEYIFYTTKRFLTIKVNGGTHGSAIPYIVYNDIAKECFPFSEKIVRNFQIKIIPILSKILNNEKEIQKLTNLRDRLLPLLMNGQVEVGTNNSSEFCNAKLGKQATACDMNGQVEVVEE